MRKTWMRVILFFAGFFLFFQTGASAEELSVSYSIAEKDTLYAFVKNPGEYDTVICQIGLEESPDVTVKELTDPDLKVSTCLLIDNSLSIQEKYRDTMKQVAKDLIFAGKSNEYFTVATFDTELHCLVENSQDSKTLIDTVEQIEFQNLDTQVINVLYQLYEKFDAEDKNSLKRIILMTDGVETKAIGYTKEELMEKVRNFGYPVYVLGCTYQSNEAELENLFRISRETNAEYFHLDDGQSADQVAAEISDSFDFLQVQAEIPEIQRDGSAKGIQIAFEKGGQEKKVSFSLTMPFLAKSETDALTEVVTEAVTEQIEAITEQPEAVTEQSEAVTEEQRTAEPITETATESSAEQVTETSAKDVFVTESGMLIVLVCIAIVAITLIILLFRKKENQKITCGSDGEKEKNQEEEKKEPGENTVLINTERTEILEGENGGPDVINIRLTDMKKPSVVIEYPLETSVIIGRSPEKSRIVFDYEKSVSGQHCELSRVGDKVFIRDLGSANNTFVDEKRVEGNQELKNGSVIKLGRLVIQFQNLSQDSDWDVGRKKKADETQHMFNF